MNLWEEFRTMYALIKDKDNCAVVANKLLHIE